MNSILTFLASLLISPVVPTPTGDWQGASEWKKQSGYWEYNATSQALVSNCRANPTAWINLPLILQGVQTIKIDDRMISQTGDPSFRTASQSFNTGTISCAEVGVGNTLTWQVRTTTESLSKLETFPNIQASRSMNELFFNTLADAAAIAIPLLGLISAGIFWGKLETKIVLRFLISALLYGMFFGLSDPGAFNVEGHPLFVFRIADSILWIATILHMQFLNAMQVISRRTLFIHNGLIAIALFLIFSSSNLDQSQVGSTMAMASNLFILTCIFFYSLRSLFGITRSRTLVLQTASLASFVVSGVNDILLANGGFNTVQVFHMGILGSMCFLALAVNERIGVTYRERDYLRENLQLEVERKTTDLKLKSTELEKTLSDLRSAQADLIHNAKLASLGTLSAGIAHEINNSLNYVNGSLQPLQTIISKPALDDADRAKLHKLLSLMKDGLGLTMGIILNLKRHIGSAQNTNEQINIRESVDGALVLLNSRISQGIKVEIDIDGKLDIRASRVGISQILMNLLTNAIDAMENHTGPKNIRISAGTRGATTWLSLTDSGPGVPENVKTRIFDPFFTTKEVGKGTGLGLHIVRQEVEKNGGSIELRNGDPHGACFLMSFPSTANTVKEAA